MPSATPFVLLGRKKLPPESAPSSEQFYDEEQQVWVDRISGLPLVSCMRTHSQASTYGETTMTETREGVDQTEGTVLQASPYGETTVTKTREGTDLTEAVAEFHASQFGETSHTATREGVDRPEITVLQASQFGETVETRTREGTDQTEITTYENSQFDETTMTIKQERVDRTERAAPLIFNAAHSHF